MRKGSGSSPPTAGGTHRRHSHDASFNFESLDGTAISMDDQSDLHDKYYFASAAKRERDDRFRFLLKHLQAIELSLIAFRSHARWFVDAITGFSDSAQLMAQDLKVRIFARTPPHEWMRK